MTEKPGPGEQTGEEKPTGPLPAVDGTQATPGDAPDDPGRAAVERAEASLEELLGLLSLEDLLPESLRAQARSGGDDDPDAPTDATVLHDPQDVLQAGPAGDGDGRADSAEDHGAAGEEADDAGAAPADPVPPDDIVAILVKALGASTGIDHERNVPPPATPVDDDAAAPLEPVPVPPDDLEAILAEALGAPLDIDDDRDRPPPEPAEPDEHAGAAQAEPVAEPRADPRADMEAILAEAIGEAPHVDDDREVASPEPDIDAPLDLAPAEDATRGSALPDADAGPSGTEDAAHARDDEDADDLRPDGPDPDSGAWTGDDVSGEPAEPVIPADADRGGQARDGLGEIDGPPAYEASGEPLLPAEAAFHDSTETAADADPDHRFMAAAIRISRRHLGLTSTNPSVGTLIVRDGIIVGRGVTALGGRPHAETQALAEAGDAARGATAYVTLEPCAHHGRTPPCAEALVAAGIARVVGAAADPDERVSGRGCAILRAAGIEVLEGVLAREAADLMAGYLCRSSRKRPEVTLKLALSADGMIGRAGAGQVAITGGISRAQVHLMRAESDVILVGIGTVQADDPELTCRLPGMAERSPARVVLDRDAKLPMMSKLALSARSLPLYLAVGPEASRVRRSSLEMLGVRFLATETHDGRIALPELLEDLAGQGYSTVLVEGGASTARAFLEDGVVDRIVLFQGPNPIGADGIPSPLTVETVPQDFDLVREARFGADRYWEWVKR